MLCLLPLSPANAEGLTLAVANSTCKAVKKVGAIFAERHAVTLNYVCKSSGRLAKGLRGGAIEADIYISANRRWMDYMQKGGLVSPEHVTSPWGNALVVAVPIDSDLEINAWDELATDKVRTILIGDPGTAPFGRYAKQALQATGLWEAVRNKIETRKHISLLADALAGADRGTVGFLFVSNLPPGKVKTVYAVNNFWHTPIRYYMAPVGDAAGREEVSALLAFMQGKAAQQIFATEGFEINSR